MTFNEQVNRKVVAIAGAVAVVLAAAVLNSQRAAHDRRQAAPSPTASATASPSPSAGPAGFVCATFEALGEMIEAGAPMRTPGHDSLVVTSVRCTDQEEDERASQVQIRDVSDDGRILSVLIRPEQMLHVASLSVDGERVTVIAVQAAPPLGSGLKAPGDLGSAFSFSYIFNGRTTTASAPRRVALGCAAQDLQVSVAQLPSSAVLHF
ncbi:MAG: hypothetical protein JWO63_1561, partial [Frankiales bacterium]|nr:hypothetical protein [Frankiales bacterium]